VIDLERLVMLALGELGDQEAAEVEEHVLGCGTCASTLERLLRIGAAAREIVRSGKVALPVTASLVEQLTSAGLVSRSYHLAPGRIVPCTAGAVDIYALTTLEADLNGIERIDIVRTAPGSSVRMRDVPFDRASGLVRFVSRSDFLRTLPTTRLRLEVLAVDEAGERKLGEYFLDHTAFVGS
jgi:hypothetical protein